MFGETLSGGAEAVRSRTIPHQRGAIGALDLAAKEHYEQELEKLEDEGLESLIVDLRALTFIDSTGINLLLRTLRDSEENGFSVTFMRGSGQVPELLETTGVAEQLPLADESALR